MGSLRYVFVLCYLLFVAATASFAQQDTLYTSKGKLYNECNEELILNGVNYSVLDDWDFPSNLFNGKEKLAEIAKSGANAVRIQWYNNYNQPSRDPYHTSELDSLLTRCKRLQIVPILGLWDLTCDSSWKNFDTTITNWWIKPDILALINKHKNYLIVNLANEFGQYEWTGDTTKALTRFVTNYSAVVVKLRKAGIHVPIMIDAPDCGQNVECISKGGNTIINADPFKNILFGVHSYWYYYTNNDPKIVNAKINMLLAAKIPVVFGEIADYQSITNGVPCQYYLDYPTLLPILKKNNIGWLAWTWYNDYCNLREMADSGLFTKLNTYGKDIVNNVTFGLKNIAIKKTCAFNINPTLPIEFCKLKQNSYSLNQVSFSLQYHFITTVQTTLQYSSNGSEWNDIARLSINNNNGNTIITLQNNAMGNGWYRVKNINDLSIIQYSNSITVTALHSMPSFTISPNPATHSISLNSLPSKANITIYSNVGKEMIHQYCATGTMLTINISMLPKGMYVAKATTLEGNSVTATFIKQ